MDILSSAEVVALTEEIKGLRKQLRAYSRGTLTRNEAATYLGISVRTLHDLRTQGKIKAVRLSPGRHAFRRGELDRYLEVNEVEADESSEAVAKRLFAETQENRERRKERRQKAAAYEDNADYDLSGSVTKVNDRSAVSMECSGNGTHSKEQSRRSYLRKVQRKAQLGMLRTRLLIEEACKNHGKNS